MAETRFTPGPSVSIARLIAAAPTLHEQLQTAVALFEMDDETNKVGTDAWLWLQRARETLKAVQK